MQEGKQRQELNRHSGPATDPPPISQAHFVPPAPPPLFPTASQGARAPVHPPPPPSLPLNSESLNRRRNIDLFQLKVEVRSTAKKGPIALLGPPNSSQFPDRFVPDIISEQILPLYNAIFTRELKEGLELGDVELRWKNNRLFRNGTEYGKLREVYNEHVNQPDAHEFFGPEVVKKKAGAGVTMHWELLINVAKYEQRTGYIIPPQLGGSGRKRGRVEQQDDDDEQAPSAKRTALRPVTSYRAAPMRTQFRNLTSHGPSATKVRLQFCRIHLNNEGQPIFNDDSRYSWDPPQDGMLNDVFTSKGRLKKVYQVPFHYILDGLTTIFNLSLLADSERRHQICGKASKLHIALFQ
ncbi:hypothetical protein EDD18DRAFT_1219978 [Armillaria luteobubalina]|uniref:Uncharacterized protein n=1 Tax=Armillaria luteobubalina TaxID=153913 RepID=A0AA39NZD3_9AGAR|nr:hypothetical protein EDD18DRAFT_1219978 [Armillaria luteobubalina]